MSTSSELSQERLISSDVQTLAEACATHYRNTNRVFCFAALIALIVVSGAGPEIESGKDGAQAMGSGVSILSFEMDAEKFFTACGVLLAMLNIAYACAHIQGYRAHLIFRNYLDSVGADSTGVSKHFSLADVAYILSTPSLQRTYPFTYFLHRRLKWIVKPISLLVNTAFHSLPIAAAVYSFFRAWKVNEDFLPIGVPATITIISCIASLILFVTVVRWFFAPPHTLLPTRQFD